MKRGPKKRKPLTIIWDFDGTILPLAPFDSEQSLLRYRMNLREEPFGWLKKAYVKAIVYADRRERLRRTFKKSYIRLLKGTPSSVLDDVSRDLAEKIPTADRRVFRQLKRDGYEMMVLSCGTADLSERILSFAGMLDCFSRIAGNCFQYEADRIMGMQLQLPNPEDKLAMIKKLKLSADRTMVVGDGYTDLPLLDWASIPVIIDRSGRQKKQFTSRRFYFISSVPEIMEIIEENLI
ncbi:MAG: HAD family hydrolase [Deltaproteobacteria bacterium]|jgi:phosphoserine phosphatase|nr:HAD family hydrolase [Deltaproteobacteria bacterium]